MKRNGYATHERTTNQSSAGTAQGEIAKHRANVEVYLEHPAGIGEHSDITEAIQVELDKIARYDDQVEVINKYFRSSQTMSDIDRRSSESN